jgi:hypothetical protein
MKIIDAYWEKKNLGIDTKEIIVSSLDTASDLRESIGSLSSDAKKYVVVKAPVKKLEHIQWLFENGFSFAETLFELSLQVKDTCSPVELKELNDSLLCNQLIKATEIERWEEEIKKGIFTTDRIALHPSFGIHVAAIRYVNWMKDELNKNSSLYEVMLDSNRIGFFALKPLLNNQFDSFLIGKYIGAKPGVGIGILSKAIEQVKQQKGEVIMTHVSSNNLSSLRMYLRLGFMPVNAVYVLSKIF